jgi:hypothetical protein
MKNIKGRKACESRKVSGFVERDFERIKKKIKQSLKRFITRFFGNKNKRFFFGG